MTGTIASILRAPALDWPDELAREAAPTPRTTMPKSIAVEVARAEDRCATEGRAA